MILTLGALSASLYGIYQIRIVSDPYDFLPADSIVRAFVDKFNWDYSVPGYPSEIVTSELEFTLADFERIDKV